MFCVLGLLFGLLHRFFHSRRNLLLENLARRQQLVAFQRRNPKLRLRGIDRLFWVVAKRLWSKWKQALMYVTPETVARWHRAGFRLYWGWLSRHSKALRRKRISKQVRDLIFQMVAENHTWGAPHIHGELLKLGFNVSECTISRWMQRAPKNPKLVRRWKAFLHNHREAIAAMDFFTVPTITFGVLHCFFVIAHDRRRILHFNVTEHPTSLWITQQLREAFPFDANSKYLIYDRDAKFGEQVSEAIRALTLQPVRTSFRSPWQNGLAERWVGGCRRDLLDHVIPLNERHLKRPLSEYVNYFHYERTHLGLKKDTPYSRPVAAQMPTAKIVALPRLGGLHHRYNVAA